MALKFESMKKCAVVGCPIETAKEAVTARLEGGELVHVVLCDKHRAECSAGATKPSAQG